MEKKPKDDQSDLKLENCKLEKLNVTQPVKISGSDFLYTVGFWTQNEVVLILQTIKVRFLDLTNPDVYHL